MALKNLVRTLMQRESDKMDLEVFRLLSRAEDFGWTTVARHLRSARANLRMTMHPDDVKASSDHKYP